LPSDGFHEILKESIQVRSSYPRLHSRRQRNEDMTAGVARLDGNAPIEQTGLRIDPAR